MDYFVKHELKVKYYIRYCDNFLILSNEKEDLKNIVLKIESFLKDKLKVSLHSGKISIEGFHKGIDFLGYVTFPHYRILRTKTKRRMLKRIIKFNKKESIESYFGILKHCEGYKLRKYIEDII